MHPDGRPPLARPHLHELEQLRLGALRARLDEALGAPRALTGEERRARAGLLSRQLTLR